MCNIYNKQSGVVSLFVVIFATLLMTVVTVSFVRIMISSQQQATVNDLSQSAYDSSLVGVEDAKRAILRMQKLCSSNATVIECAAARSSFDSPECNAATDTLSDVNASAGQEVQVQTGGTSNNLRQAYTCTKITLDTDDYKGSLLKNEQKIIPLRGVSNFNIVRIQWFSEKDIYPLTAVDRQSAPNTTDTPLLASWPANRPPIMRAQQINMSNVFDLASFDGPQNNSNTVFLYPSAAGPFPSGPLDEFSGRDVRRDSASLRIISSSCLSSLSTGGYACSTRLQLPVLVEPDNKTVYLRLGALYNKANYRITLLDSTLAPVKFKEVQPSIDSTGRANDLFRRVEARVELSSDFIYPMAAVYTRDTFCKDFLVTDSVDDYDNACSL